MKNIALFCDGTWQNLSQPFPTNVTRLARAVAASTAHPTSGSQTISQCVYYDNGVGVGEGVADGVVRFFGGTLGSGLDRKLEHAYEFICLNYEPGDRIFVFGFSRGAYTARSLVGLLRHCWILRRENVGVCSHAVNLYRDHSKDAVELATFKENMCHPAALFQGQRDAAGGALKVAATPAKEAKIGWVQYVGVWDTVGSMGIPTGLPFADAVNDRYRFHDTSLSRFVWGARHAVAIDERREAFSPTLWDNIPELNGNAGAGQSPYAARPYQQLWFPGAHGAVGGGEDDGGVSISPLLWIAQGAAHAGLAFDGRLLARYVAANNPGAPFRRKGQSIADFALKAAGLKDRSPVGSVDDVSWAACTRWRTAQAYRPAPLKHLSAQISVLDLSNLDPANPRVESGRAASEEP